MRATLALRRNALVRAIAPGFFAGVMALVNRLLPGPAAVGGDQARPGRESESR